LARILLISSLVAHGHVGISAMLPALQHFGHDVISLPTIMLSNHPGHAHSSGFDVAPSQLSETLEALASNGWLTDIDGVISGYLPSVQHVEFTRQCFGQVRSESPNVRYFAIP
jgi:pyridoxine kinase